MLMCSVSSEASLNYFLLCKPSLGVSPPHTEVITSSVTTVHCLCFYYMLIREGNGTPLQYPCLENPMDGGAWWAAVHGVARSRTRLSNFAFTFHFPALEKEMATHSSVLAWRISGTGEPGGCHLWGHTELDTTEVT